VWLCLGWGGAWSSAAWTRRLPSPGPAALSVPGRRSRRGRGSGRRRGTRTHVPALPPELPYGRPPCPASPRRRGPAILGAPWDSGLRTGGDQTFPRAPGPSPTRWMSPPAPPGQREVHAAPSCQVRVTRLRLSPACLFHPFSFPKMEKMPPPSQGQREDDRCALRSLQTSLLVDGIPDGSRRCPARPGLPGTWCDLWLVLG
jgi:hypothetical protein